FAEAADLACRAPECSGLQGSLGEHRSIDGEGIEMDSQSAARGSGGPETAGWPVLHSFYRIVRSQWRSLDQRARSAALDEFSALLHRSQGEEGLQLVTLGLIGKADLGLLAVHPDVRRIQRLGQEIAASVLGSCLEVVYSFLSISEISEYQSSTGDQAR